MVGLKTLIILTLIAVGIKATDLPSASDCGSSNPSKASDCYSATVDTGKKCCYFQFEMAIVGGTEFCVLYDKSVDEQSMSSQFGSLYKVSIDCSSTRYLFSVFILFAYIVLL